jgi:hypothetical protein
MPHCGLALGWLYRDVVLFAELHFWGTWLAQANTEVMQHEPCLQHREAFLWMGSVYSKALLLSFLPEGVAVTAQDFAHASGASTMSAVALGVVASAMAAGGAAGTAAVVLTAAAVAVAASILATLPSVMIGRAMRMLLLDVGWWPLWEDMSGQ